VHRAYRKNGEADVAALQAANEYDFLQFYRRKPDACTGLVGCAYGCLGPTFTIVSACAAGAQAIGEAFRAVRRGEADAVLCGGAEAALVYTGYVGFVLLRALCERYRSPETASRPFDRRRNGFVMSEGAAALVLEELGHARSRRAPILGEVVGYGDSADAYRITDVHPNAEGAILAMRGALEDARIWPDQVQYINAHGTSTKLNDQAESYGIRVVFGDSIRHIPASSNKSMLGHAIAAAGAIEAILTLVGMQQSVILPTINYENPDPKCDLPDYVPNEARHCEHSLAISNSFGFGGQNACLCLAAYRGE
jgi:3-oxoacyl-[acyl-carrier-protein] synthase II